MGGFGPTDRALNIEPTFETNRAAEEVKLAPDELQTQPFGGYSFANPFPDTNPTVGAQILVKNLCKRAPFIAAASKRAQAASGARNSQIHRVPGQPSEGRALDGLMDIERTLKLGRQRGTGFRALLASSKSFGYHFLDVEWINFRIPKSIESLKKFGKELGSEVCDQNLRMVSEIVLRPGCRGGIKVIEVEIDAIPWIIIEIRMNLAEVRGAAPRELDPMPTTELRIAAPRDKVSTMPIPEVGQAAREKSLRLKFCRDGVPLFLISRQAPLPAQSNTKDDFFHAANIPGLREEEGNKATELFWKRFDDSAASDRKIWAQVQHYMAMGYCVVDMEIEAPWAMVAGTKTKMLPPPPALCSDYKKRPGRPKKT
ncbi:predicted protein [Verticillium alfalfae VaMs.102]|uniref:Predicted protein n=1 Tax=Verticillium alfalfae (strain VaMs.102 / ATCC MYA-4576 / FGSC 10136) TaxID=526221 RepID=C9SE33_VERA1|nr:predicted protein [Verticillium alfalfae VaMs.102]EEY17280.1 predicted protein [Verticillium alfalfae VaMs.102]